MRPNFPSKDEEAKNEARNAFNRFQETYTHQALAHILNQPRLVLEYKTAYQQLQSTHWNNYPAINELATTVSSSYTRHYLVPAIDHAKKTTTFKESLNF